MLMICTAILTAHLSKSSWVVWRHLLSIGMKPCHRRDKGEKKYWYQSKSELNRYTEQYKKSTEVTSQLSYQHKEKSGKSVEISGEEANKHPLYVELKKIAGEASTVSSFCLAIHAKVFCFIL